MAERKRFFRVIMDDCLSKLPLPPTFCGRLKRKRSGEALIKCYERNWRIQVSTDSGGSLYFGSGWEDFVKGHQINLGDFVVFQHQGDWKFDAIVFDSTACKKDLPVFASSSSKKKMKDKTIPSDERTRNPMDDAEFYNTDRPHFIKTIAASDGPNSLCQLIIPVAFAKEHNLERASDLFLRDSSGKLWPIKICTRDAKSKKTDAMCERTTIRKGWREFYVAKSLKDGDVCLFELDVSDKKSPNTVMDVHIFPSGV